MFEQMRRLALPATFLLLLFKVVTAQAQERDLQLTASIAGQSTCTVSQTVDALRLTLQLRYTNVGKQKLILYKGNRLFFQIFISRGSDEAAARRNELRTTHSRYFDEQPEKIVASAPGSVFTTLSPGASYETRQLISIPVARSGEGRFNVSVPAGEHVLNIATSTWYESKKLADDLRERWRTRGYLWTDPLGSNTVAFVIDKNRPAAACQ
jgi:hypothetical protein